jgi:hypothetical protein
MPLAFLVEQFGVACMADLWRIELQCDLSCQPFYLCPDAPLAHLIGMQDKRATGIGVPSLTHPFARAFPLSLPRRRCPYDQIRSG